MKIRLLFKVSFGVILVLFLVGVIWAHDQNSKPKEVKQEVVQSMAVSIVADRREPSLQFDWGEKKPALAVVKHFLTSDNGKWWIVFDEQASVSLPDMKDNDSDFKSIQILPTKNAVVIQVNADPKLTPVIKQEGGKWYIIFKDQVLTIVHKAPLHFPQTQQDGFGVGLQSPGGGSSLRRSPNRPSPGYFSNLSSWFRG